MSLALGDGGPTRCDSIYDTCAPLAPAELLAVCLAGPNSDAWREFVRRIHPVVTASVSRVVRRFGLASRPLIEDLVQEVYLRLCEDRCRVLREFRSDTPEALYAFLKVVAANVARSYCKATISLKSGAGKIVSMPERLENVAATYGADAESTLFIKDLDALLSRMNSESIERDKAIFWLYYRQGWSSRDIASLKTLGLSQKGVESLLQRLAKFVRARLNGVGEKDLVTGAHPIEGSGGDG
jgi:RNA polymerase sigma-70 factor, ECF subfamily